MTRHNVRTDATQPQIVDTLERLGYAVRDLRHAGRGCPDLVLSRHGRTWLAECKVGTAKLNPRQARWLDGWQGDVLLLRTADDALAWALGQRGEGR